MVNTGMLENYIEKERIGGKNTRKNVIFNYSDSCEYPYLFKSFNFLSFTF